MKIKGVKKNRISTLQILIIYGYDYKTLNTSGISKVFSIFIHIFELVLLDAYILMDILIHESFFLFCIIFNFIFLSDHIIFERTDSTHFK
jgi:hypothetical protein